jgi:carboxypeptidase family protein
MKRIFVTLSAALLFPLTSSALISFSLGNDPVRDPGWPLGALEVANLKWRVAHAEGPLGQHSTFSYRGDTEAFMKALTNFAAIRAPALDLVIHDGPQEVSYLKDPKDANSNARLDWSFTIWVPASWHQIFNNPKSHFAEDSTNFRQPVDPPRLEVYIGGGGVDWTKVEVPANVRVRDERESASGVVAVGGGMSRVDAYDMGTGKPIPGVRVVVAKATEQRAGEQPADQTIAEAQGGDDGVIEVTKIPPGTHRVWIEAAGYAPRLLGSYERFTERTFKHYTTELAKLASVNGTVTDGEGKPLPNAQVEIDSAMGMDARSYGLPDARPVVTDASGHFELTRLPAGYLRLRTTAPGFQYHYDRTIYDAPTNGLVFRLFSAGGIRVTVTDKSGRAISRFEGNPIMVHFEPKEGSTIGSWGGDATVKDDGTFEFTKVPPGEYRISSHPNPSSTQRKYAPDQIVTVKPGEPISVKIIYE